MRRVLLGTMMGLSCMASNLFAGELCENNTLFNIGVGIDDITGPAAEQGMMGYAMIQQQTAGLHSRLWARAFVIESPCNGKRLVLVSADLGQLFQGVKLQVIKELKKRFGERYRAENVILSATHQHSGPGGYSTYTLYNLSTFGFNRANFNAIVDGIVGAIQRADQNITPGHIRIARGDVQGASFNRSPTAYALNPRDEQARFASNVDTEMTLLRFEHLDGTPIGLINWFPVHGVSMNNKNHLINGDNKGYAAYLFERDWQSDYGPHAFVAAFAQANAGDVTPNANGAEGGAGVEGMTAVKRAALPQYQTAKYLFANASELVRGGVDYRHQYKNMAQIELEARLTDGKPHTTCPAALGVSMLAGTSDGEGLGKQGVNCSNIGTVIPGVACAMTTTVCQGVKPIALETGTMLPYSWTPNILPLQVAQIGNVALGALPFELTTMTGRRIKAALANALPQTQYVVLSALSNGYAQYVATHEEYQLQRYEGASTLFGPWQEVALRQELTHLAQAMATHQPVTAGPQPLDLLDKQVDLQTGVLFDDKPIGKKFGSIAKDVNETYHPGDEVVAQFLGAHPKNNFHRRDTFVAVEQLNAGQWQRVLQDRDWELSYTWQRNGVAFSLITVRWQIPSDRAPGLYRLVQYGDSKAFGGKITPYVGYSREFVVR